MHYSPQELLNRKELFNNGVVNLQDFNELKYVLLYDCKKRKKKKEEKTGTYSYITIRIFEEYNMSSRSET